MCRVRFARVSCPWLRFGHSWLEAGDAAQIAGRWLASHPSERLGLVCACARAASSARCSSPIWAWIAQRLRLRAFWALRSRHTAVGGWAPAVRRRCRRLGGRACADARDGWRYTHDYIASTVFDLVSLAGISGTMEPRGIFSMAVPAEVLAEDGSRRSRPGAVPDYCFTVDGRCMLYDVIT